MKKTAIAILGSLIVAISAAFTSFEDILSLLGLDKPFTNEMMFKQMTGIDEFRIPYMTGLPKVMAGDQVGAAKESFAYVKSYFESPEFAAAYQQRREREKPTDEPPPMFDEETLKEMKESLKYNEKEAANPKNSAQARAASKQQADEIRQLVELGADPTPNKTKWEKKFPQDPSKRIAAKLQEYLNLAAAVDYSAQLTPPDKYGKKKFVNPEYEKKSNQWKAVYRAGKDVNAAVSAMARDWLKAGIRIAAPGSISSANDNNAVQQENKDRDQESSSPKADEGPIKKPTLRSLKDKYLPRKN